MALKRLEDAKLLTVNRNAAGTLLSLDAHPLLREYFARQLRSGSAGVSQAASAGRSRERRDGHQRLYEHLCATTKEGDQPTLEDLQPLYQAVAHGCQAEMHHEAAEQVYHARIKRRDENSARGDSVRSVPTWAPSPASSSRHGAACRPRSRKSGKPGC